MFDKPMTTLFAVCLSTNHTSLSSPALLSLMKPRLFLPISQLPSTFEDGNDSFLTHNFLLAVESPQDTERYQQ